MAQQMADLGSLPVSGACFEVDGAESPRACNLQAWKLLISRARSARNC